MCKIKSGLSQISGRSYSHCQRLAEISKQTLNATSDAAVSLDLASPVPLSRILSQFQFEAVSLSQAMCVGRCRDEFRAT